MRKATSVVLTTTAVAVMLVGCASPRDGRELQAKISEAEEGDFGTCLENVYESAAALAEARLVLSDAQGDGVTDKRYQYGLQRADEAVASRKAAEEACNVRTAELERTIEILKGVTFEEGSAALLAEARTVLDLAANKMLRSPRRVEVAGHTSNTGSPEFNMQLSQRRAEAVRDYLVSKGVNRDLITARGYGMSEPIASNSTEDGRTANKRVELRFQ